MRWALFALLAAGCGGSSQQTEMTTGLVVTLDYDESGVDVVTVRGSASTRSFGPYTMSVDKAPPSSTVGLIFDPSDDGPAMVCGYASDDRGNLRASGCIMPSVQADQVLNVKLSLARVD
jgi:hypothetical protein